ncbi:MAG: dicarboxylate/amino acid:cation symporter [Pirellulales bacterium]|nr:dicarboxylate/amino acid:cation symporter [Pirellulales bacterium]
MTHSHHVHSRSWLTSWQKIPLYLRIVAACALGLIIGLALGAVPGWLPDSWHTFFMGEGRITAALLVLPLEMPSKLVLRLLGALAAPLVFLAVIQALMHAQLPPGTGWRLVRLLLVNTLVAIFIGLAVANVLQPGSWSQPAETTASESAKSGPNPVALFLDNVPKSLLGPFGDEGKVLSVILLAVAFGIALRRFKTRPIGNIAELVTVGFEALLVVLHWIIEVIPLAVFGIVAALIAVQGLSAFVALGGFVAAVLIALALQTVYYLMRIRFGSWVNPWRMLAGMRDALVMAFSTGSSTATMPVTYACLREKVGLRERSASLGALVGANFNNDGTALYEAMSALFISQLLVTQGLAEPLTLWQQVLVVVTSVVASVGAAGIPEAGLVTMTLVFNAVGLPTKYIALLLTVDWFLDRCRTTVNVLGDVTVSCLLDGNVPEIAPTPETSQIQSRAAAPPPEPPVTTTDAPTSPTQNTLSA